MAFTVKYSTLVSGDTFKCYVDSLLIYRKVNETTCEHAHDRSLPVVPVVSPDTLMVYPHRLVTNRRTPLNGETVVVQGHPMVVSNVRFYEDDPEHPEKSRGKVLRFTGTCTGDKVNDPIRHSGYNGGNYGWGLW